MVNRTRPGEGVRSLVPPPERDGRAEREDDVDPSSPAPSRAVAGGVADAGDVHRKAPAIQHLPDGTICIGSGCVVTRIPPTGDIQYDVRDCPDDVADALDKRLAEGAGVDFKMKPRRKP